MQWLTEETGWLFPEDDAELLPDQPEQLPALGAGLAGAAECVMIGCADSDAAAAAAHLLCGGAAAAGGSVCFAPDCIPAARRSPASLRPARTLRRQPDTDFCARTASADGCTAPDGPQRVCIAAMATPDRMRQHRDRTDAE